MEVIEYLQLSEGIPHVRIDLYNVNGKIYFGEITFFHGAGLGRFTPEEWNEKFGDLIRLPNK
ncbi:ATP-grasp fold amidoligase family protein [Parabacteroides sp.]